MLKVNNINVSYEDKIIFKNANFIAYPNELTVVIGQSGSGKTTLFNILKTQKDINDSNFCYRITAMMQNSVFIDDLRVDQHISMFKKTPFIEKIINELDVLSFYKKKIKQLSGGERQRLAFLFAIMQDSYILLCDEPTASLNKDYSQKISVFLKEYAHQGHVVVVMTHDDILIRESDCLYQIDNLKILKKKNGVSKNLDVIPKKNSFSLPLRTYFYLIINKKISLIMILLISLSISLLSFSFSYGNLSQKYFNEERSLSNLTAVIYKEILPNEFSGYSYYEEPLMSQEITQIKNIEGVKDIWALYCGNPNLYINLEDEQSTKKSFKLYEDNELIKETVLDETDEGYNDITYNSDFDYSQDPAIYKDFGNKDGVYITISLLEKLGINIDELNNKSELEFSIRIPQYTILNYAQFISNDGEIEKYGHNVSTKMQTVRLKISGILNTSSFSLGINSLMTDNAIFYPLEVANQYVQKYRVQESISFKSVYDGQTYQAIPFETPYYIISFDNNADYNLIINKLDELGLSYDSRYIYNSTLMDSLISNRYQIIFITAILFVLLSILYVVIQMNQKKSFDNFNYFFKSLGFNKKEIKQINVNRVICNMLMKIILSSLLIFIIIYCSHYFTSELTIFDIRTALIMIGMIILLELMTYLSIQKGKQ